MSYQDDDLADQFPELADAGVLDLIQADSEDERAAVASEVQRRVEAIRAAAQTAEPDDADALTDRLSEAVKAGDRRAYLAAARERAVRAMSAAPTTPKATTERKPDNDLESRMDAAVKAGDRAAVFAPARERAMRGAK